MAGTGFLWMTVASATIVLVDAFGWADVPGSGFALVAVVPFLAAGSILCSSGRHAEGEARREAARRPCS